MDPQFSIVFTNKSTNGWSACVFQRQPEINSPNVISAAWFAQMCNPDTSCTFTWTLEYGFCWSETGQLASQINANATAYLPIPSLTNGNTVTLDYNGAFLFTNQGNGTPQGSLYINQSANVPLNTGLVGIGMSGAATFLVPAVPNNTLVFSPKPEYWMAFGQFAPGQALDVQQMSTTVQVVFPPAITTMYVTLNQANLWTVSQSPG